MDKIHLGRYTDNNRCITYYNLIVVKLYTHINNNCQDECYYLLGYQLIHIETNLPTFMCNLYCYYRLYLYIGDTQKHKLLYYALIMKESSFRM